MKIMAAKGIAHGVIVCSHATRRALFRAGLDLLDLAVTEMEAKTVNGEPVPLPPRFVLEDRDVVDAINARAYAAEDHARMEGE